MIQLLEVIWLVGLYGHVAFMLLAARAEVKPWEKPRFVLRAFGLCVCWPVLFMLSVWLGYRELFGL